LRSVRHPRTCRGGESISEYEVKAAYLYRFGKLTASPRAAKSCRAGTPSLPIASLAGKTAKGATSPSAVSIRGNVGRGVVFLGECPGTPLGSKPGQAVLTVTDCPTPTGT
jgi:hypothetical protein